MATQALESLCPQCGAALRCGVASGDATCWCFDLPLVVPLPSQDPAQKPSCLCAACLQKLIDKNDLQ